MATYRPEKCSMDGCINDVVYKRRGICSACYSFMKYWGDRSVSDKILHAQKIERWEKRAHVVLTPKKVTSIPRKKRRVAGGRR